MSSLIILKRIMHVLGTQLKSDEIESLRPCEYFDMIAGTSTGGLIAIMLGTLRMNIDECITAYLALAPKIFPKKSFLSNNKLIKLFNAGRGSARFDATALEEEVKKLVTRYLKKNPDAVFGRSKTLVKVVVCKFYVVHLVADL